MYTRLSRETIVRRFFTMMPTLKGPLLGCLTNVDHDRHEAMVVTVGDEIVALASYHRDPVDPTRADVAVLIEDHWQHHGLGRQLIKRLGRVAEQRGLTAFHADVLVDNKAAAGLIHRMDRRAHATWKGDALSYDLPLRAA
jgi:GNAT superfamily N-acetyltransferase